MELLRGVWKGLSRLIELLLLIGLHIVLLLLRATGGIIIGLVLFIVVVVVCAIGKLEVISR